MCHRRRTLRLLPMSAGRPQMMASSQMDTAMARVMRVARRPPPKEVNEKKMRDLSKIAFTFHFLLTMCVELA